MAGNAEGWRLVKHALFRFKAERIRRGIKTQDMANQLGITRMSLYALESGRYFGKRQCPDPKFSLVYRYAKALGLSLDALDQEVHALLDRPEPEEVIREPMTTERAKELGRMGGKATLAKHGLAHFRTAAAKGGRMRRGRKYPRV